MGLMGIRGVMGMRGAIMATVLAASSFAPAEEFTLRYDPTKAGADNPLKGFMPYVGEYDFPYSLEYTYLAMSDLRPAAARYDFATTVEPFLNDVASRGNHAVFRVFIDYPEERFALPADLVAAGVKLTPYTDYGGGKSPDYNNPKLVTAMEELIAKLGARYDGDPRIGFIEVGMLGFWGEWHTYPHDELFASPATQQRILTAYARAFTKTHLLVSQDVLGHDDFTFPKSLRIGFHDDAFLDETLGPEESNFAPRLRRLGFDTRWRTLPIGGEILPDLQSKTWDAPSRSQDFTACVKATHASWLLNDAPFEAHWDAAKRARVIAGAQQLGYQFHIPAAEWSQVGDNVKLSITAENHGVAPFYYPWTTTLALRDISGFVVAQWSPDWDWRTVMPDEPAPRFSFAGKLPPEVKPGRYRLLLRINNPLPKGKPLHLANGEQEDEWLVLGKVAITALPLAE